MYSSSLNNTSPHLPRFPPLWTSEVWHWRTREQRLSAPQSCISYASFSISAIARGICRRVSSVVFLMCCYTSSLAYAYLPRTALSLMELNMQSFSMEMYLLSKEVFDTGDDISFEKEKFYFWCFEVTELNCVLLRQLYFPPHSEVHLHGPDLFWRPAFSDQELQGMQGKISSHAGRVSIQHFASTPSMRSRWSVFLQRKRSV